MARVGSVLLGTLALILLVASCTGGEQAGSAGTTASGAAASAGTAASPGVMKALAVAYLAIAKPANRRLDSENDRFSDDEHGDMAAAESDLRAEAATEQLFDQQLSKIRFPPQMALPVRALLQANARRITLTLRQARSSPVTGLLSLAHRHQAADAAVEAQVKVIRRDLGLPPPSDS